MSALCGVFTGLKYTGRFFKGEDEPVDYSGFDIIVLDSYLLSDEYIAELNAPGKAVVCYDDNALYTYNCDIVLNSNLYADELSFKTSVKTPKMLLGGKYALLRKEFRNANVITINKNANRIFICFGGSDIRNMTPGIIKTLRDIKDIELNVVVGGYAKNYDDVSELACDNVIIHHAPESMVDIMTKCDIAVTSSGSMTYELAALGIPSLTISQADNQLQIAEYMSRNKLSKNLGDWKNIDYDNVRIGATELLSDYSRRLDESKRLSGAVDKNGAVNAATDILKFVAAVGGGHKV
jgi:spore coat polysaccharide biosynthesis predicted glycosyltransferase SpsG